MRKAVRILSIIVATFFVVQPFSYAEAQTIYTEFEPVESNQIKSMLPIQHQNLML